MKVRTRMDSGLYGLIFGFFAIGWFSWGEGEASGALSLALVVGVWIALVVAVFGAIRAFRPPRTEGAINDRAGGRRYGLVVAIEFGLAGIGAVVLGRAGAEAFIPVWICAVVGVHFFALVSVMHDPALRWLGVVVTSVAVAALLVGVFTGVAPALVTGVGAGVAILTYGILALAGPVRPRVAA